MNKKIIHKIIPFITKINLIEYLQNFTISFTK